MTASFVQVRPLGIYPAHPPRPRDPVQVLRARRCLFGPSDPAETNRLLREEERANLEYLQQTYQIIDTIEEMHYGAPRPRPNAEVEIATNSESEVASAAVGTANIVAAAEVVPRIENPMIIDNDAVPTPMQIEPTQQQQQSADVAIIAVQSVVGRLQRNPGPLKNFPIRKHPYASPSKQSRRIARNANPPQYAPSHH